MRFFGQELQLERKDCFCRLRTKGSLLILKQYDGSKPRLTLQIAIYAFCSSVFEYI